MLFNSYGFLLFVGAAAIIFHGTPVRWRSWVMLAASYAFYALFSVTHVWLMLGASILAWALGRRIRGARDDRTRTTLLAVTVALLLVPLATFKYAPGLGGLPAFAVPVGISYYTFKLVSYVVDTYWEKIETEHDLFAVMRYAAFFPQIASGPIQRADDFFAQERSPREPDVSLIRSGARLMLFGYFKKLVVADRAALIVDQTFGRPEAHAPALHWLGAYLFAIQLYADFSGITDIANGAGRMFGIDGPPNFDNPYYAPNMQDFWRRWHISLTSWLTDYVFMPLRMALRNLGRLGLAIAITATMLGVGIWHGRNWTFVLAGSMYALYMIVSSLTLKPRDKWFAKRPALARPRRVVGAIVVFHLMTVAFIPVRAANVHDAFYIMSQFARGLLAGPLALLHPGDLVRTLDGWSNQQWALLAFGLVVMELVHLGKARGWARAFDERPRWQRWTAYYALGLALLVFSVARSASFIYFKF